MPDQKQIEKKNRIEIFRDLTLKDGAIDPDKFEAILDPQYEHFQSFCELVQNEDEFISSVSCALEDDIVVFNIKLINGETKEIRFEN